jgi:hypothetical protein
MEEWEHEDNDASTEIDDSEENYFVEHVAECNVEAETYISNATPASKRKSASHLEPSMTM